MRGLYSPSSIWAVFVSLPQAYKIVLEVIKKQYIEYFTRTLRHVEV